MQLYGYYPDDVTKALFWLFAILFVPSAVIACMAIDRRSAVWTMGAFVTGTTLSSGVAIADLIGLTPNIGRALGQSTQICLYKCINAGSGARMNGLTDHPNTLGITAAISIPIAIYFMSTMHRKWIAAIALVVLFGGILASGSRGAQAAAPLCALIAVLWTPKDPSLGHARSIVTLGTVLGGFAILLILPSRVRQSLFRIFEGSPDASGSNSERFTLLRAALADWQAHPVFGSGIRHIVEAHNIYLQFLASGGVVLAMSMLIYFFLVLRASWQLSSQGIAYARFLMISIGTWLVLGLVENAVADRYLYYSVGCVAALASVNLRHQGDTSQLRARGTSYLKPHTAFPSATRPPS
jgi:O-antigen ligase